MFEEIDARFEYMLNLLSKNDVNIAMIKKAYEKAKSLHYYQKRKDGTPYLSHPVEVAMILAELGFDENAICGALLHDTVEDCGYTIEEIEKEFNHKIAEAVDSVSAIDKTRYSYDQDEIYEDPNFVKSSAEEQTFKKLIKIGKKNPLGFCIKFADRIHNLRTIDSFDYTKQLEKVRETEKWILPIAKALKAQFFYVVIINECFKIVHRYEGKHFFEQYRAYHDSNRKNVEEILSLFKETFVNDVIRNDFVDDLSERKIFDELAEQKKNLKIRDILQEQIINVANYAFYVTYKTGTDRAVVTNQILSKFSKVPNLPKIIDAKIGSFSSQPYFVLQDNFKNNYRLYVLSTNEYQNLLVGAIDGRLNDNIDEENINNLDLDTIKVKTQSGEVKTIAKGSTVLDFAFKIHRDLGFSFKYAIINDGKTKFPPYTKLNENDKVEIVIEKDENGNLINNAKLRWLAYVNTEFAKKVLIKWFESF